MKIRRETLKRILVTVAALLFGLMICATAIALDNETAVNEFFHAETFVTEQKDPNAPATDTEYFKSSNTSVKQTLEKNLATLESIEAQGAVLLKNDADALPLAKGSSVSLFSYSSVDPAYMGKGSASLGTRGTPVDFKQAMTAAGFKINETLWNFYESNPQYAQTDANKGALINDAPWNEVQSAAGSSFAQYGDAAIFVVSRRAGGEGTDYKLTGTDGENGDYLRLSENEMSVLRGLAAAKGSVFKKIIVLLNSANHVDAEYWSDPSLKIDSVLWIGNVGRTGLSAVAKILSGEVVPSGRASDMFWAKNSLNPAIANFGATEYANASAYASQLPVSSLASRYNKYVVYQEGVYMGYRYAETRYEDVVMKTPNAGDFKYSDAVAYPFGYGLSYTDFEYSAFDVAEQGDKFVVTVTVTNTGDEYMGRETVQIYAQKPYGDYAKKNKIEKPSVELVGFAKTNPLAPGKPQTLTIEIDKSRLTSYDANGAKTYIIDGGKHYFTAAKNAHDAVNNILAKKGYAEKDGMDAAGDAELVKEFTLASDAETYSVSEATDKKITNLFDQADINKYAGKGDNKVVYVSRGDWTGTLPKKTAKLNMTQQMVDDMRAQDDPGTIKKQEGEYPVMGKSAGLSLAALRVDDKGNEIPADSAVWDTFIQQFSWEELVFLITNGFYRTGGLSEPYNIPETKSADGPTGMTKTYDGYKSGLATKKDDPDKGEGMPYYPCISILASTFDVEMAEAYGTAIGEDSLWSGYTGFYGIGLNMHRTAYSGRNYEYFGEDPFLSGIMAAHEVEAMQSLGVSAYLKHFALNDMEAQRVGINVWVNEQTLREIYLKPFELAVTEGGAMNVMTSFPRIGVTLCPASKALQTDFIRGECGLRGLSITDMWQIGYKDEQYPIFNLAGTDLPIYDMSANVFGAFKTGYANVANAMQASARRILYSVVRSNAMNGFDTNTRVRIVTPAWIIAVTAVDAVLGAALLASVAYVVVDYLLQKKQCESR